MPKRPFICYRKSYRGPMSLHLQLDPKRPACSTTLGVPRKLVNGLVNGLSLQNIRFVSREKMKKTFTHHLLTSWDIQATPNQLFPPAMLPQHGHVDHSNARDPKSAKRSHLDYSNLTSEQNACYNPLSWLVNRDPHRPYNWVITPITTCRGPPCRNTSAYPTSPWQAKKKPPPTKPCKVGPPKKQVISGPNNIGRK